LGTLSAVLILFVLLWGPYLWEQRSMVYINNLWQVEATDKHLVRTLWRILLVPTQILFYPPNPTWPIGLFALALLIPVLLSLGNQRLRSDLLFWWIWLSTTLGMVLATDLFRHAAQIGMARYLVLPAPALVMLVACALKNRSRRWRHLLPLGVTLACLFLLPNSLGHRRENWRLLAEQLRQESLGGEPIVLIHRSPRPWRAGALYLGVLHYLRPLPGPIVVLVAPPRPELVRQLAERKRVFLVTTAAQPPPEGLLPGAKIVHRARHPGIGRLWSGERLSPTSGR
jgi:hypothetical protein